MLPTVRHPFRRRCRRAFGRLGVLLLVASGLALAHRPFLVGFAHLFRVDEPVASDAIVLLLGGADHRPAKAADLFRRYLAPRIVMASSRPTGPVELRETDLCRRELLRGGVPAGAIEILHGIGTSTHTEASLVRDHAQKQGLRSILVVTTAFHTARSRWVFRKVLRGTGVVIHLAAADHPDFDEANWFTLDEGVLAYFNESLKAIYYRLVY